MSKMMLPAGRTAEQRHLEYSEEMQCFTVRCGCCGEDLPCDAEFYSRDGRGPASWCKACRAERSGRWYRQRGGQMRKARRAAAPVADCPQPETPWTPIVQAVCHG